MRIGIDGGCWNVKRGYGRFLRELLSAIAALETQHEFYVFLDRAGFETFHLADRLRAVCVEAADTVTAAGAESRRSIPDLLRMSRAVSAANVDVVFFPSVYSWFPLFGRTPMLLGIHDTIADKNPQFAFATHRQARMWRWKVWLAIKQATMILTVSEYSKKSIAAHHDIAADRIRVVYEGGAPMFRRLPVPAVDPAFVLYVGGISPNKNLEGLLRAYALLRTRKERPLRLVLVGDYQGDSFLSDYERLKRIASDLGLKDELEFAGFVPDEKLAEMYNQAAVFVMPSFDEGFGLPALEAMACGAPVVVSSGNALEEITGGAALHVDPHDIAGMTAAIDTILSDPEVARSLSERSLRRAAEFSWEKCARSVVALLEEIAR